MPKIYDLIRGGDPVGDQTPTLWQCEHPVASGGPHLFRFKRYVFHLNV